MIQRTAHRRRVPDSPSSNHTVLRSHVVTESVETTSTTDQKYASNCLMHRDRIFCERRRTGVDWRRRRVSHVIRSSSSHPVPTGLVWLFGWFGCWYQLHKTAQHTVSEWDAERCSEEWTLAAGSVAVSNSWWQRKWTYFDVEDKENGQNNGDQQTKQISQTDE